MKSVLISIQPKWCELIASGKKTVEVRKTRPKLDTPFKCYIYCTHSKNGIAYCKGNNILNGKVIGEFVCDMVFKIDKDSIDFIYRLEDYSMYFGFGKRAYNLDPCLAENELIDYLNHKQGYGWHISNLVIYDKPRELSEFYRHDNTYDNAFGWAFDDRAKSIPITRPPQSWCYVEGD